MRMSSSSSSSWMSLPARRRRSHRRGCHSQCATSRLLGPALLLQAVELGMRHKALAPDAQAATPIEPRNLGSVICGYTDKQSTSCERWLMGSFAMVAALRELGQVQLAAAIEAFRAGDQAWNMPSLSQDVRTEVIGGVALLCYRLLGSRTFQAELLPRAAQLLHGGGAEHDQELRSPLLPAGPAAPRRARPGAGERQHLGFLRAALLRRGPSW